MFRVSVINYTMSFDMSFLSYLIHSRKTKLTLGVPRVYPSTTPGQPLKPKRTDSILATEPQEELPTAKQRRRHRPKAQALEWDTDVNLSPQREACSPMIPLSVSLCSLLATPSPCLQLLLNLSHCASAQSNLPLHHSTSLPSKDFHACIPLEHRSS